MHQRTLILFVVMLLFSFRVSAQYTENVKIGETNQHSVDSLPVYNIKQAMIAPSYYSTHLGFFCRQELKLEKAISIPVRIRIGSVDHVNWLERKPNAIMPSR